MQACNNVCRPAFWCLISYFQHHWWTYDWSRLKADVVYVVTEMRCDSTPCWDVLITLFQFLQCQSVLHNTYTVQLQVPKIIRWKTGVSVVTKHGSALLCAHDNHDWLSTSRPPSSYQNTDNQPVEFLTECIQLKSAKLTTGHTLPYREKCCLNISTQGL